MEAKELLYGKEHKRAELALKESEPKFRMLADAISAATFIEQSSQCSYANRPVEWITGYGRDELVKMSFGGMVVPDSRKSVFEKQRNARWLDVNGGLFQLEGRLGTLITVHFSGYGIL